MRSEHFLTKQQRADSRRIAARNWNNINYSLSEFGDDFKRKEVRRLIKIDIEREVKSRKRFGSILTSIIISIMLRVAMKWIERWIEQKLFSVSESDDV
tara:strand:- start:169 stop:462 length:294 start_codon:yes stop_codon:yes gene_type:complete